MVKRIKIFSLLVVISFGLNGCGGGGGGSAGTDTPTATTQTGTFIDAPVEGLEYSTPTLSGFTNGNGEFQYKTGETVTFKIGNLELGSATGGATITPLTLAGDTDLNNIGTKATNIARILQTLDNNSTNGAKLVIPSSLRDLNISGTNLESDSVLNEILTKAQAKTSVAYTLKDATLARNEMKTYVSAYTNVINNPLYKKINTTSYLAKGTQYYLLTLNEESKVLMTHTGTRRFGINMRLRGGNLITIYDVNFNEIVLHDEKLYAGTYIIKVEHDTEANSQFAINSPALIDQMKHERITNGTFKDNGYYKYYSLHMPTNGFINLEVSGAIRYQRNPIKLYDKDLNLLQEDFYGQNNLLTGDYILLVNFSYPDYPINGDLTILSDVL